MSASEGHVPSDSVWHPERVTGNADGTTAAFVLPACRSGADELAGVWSGPLRGAPTRLCKDVPLSNLAFGPDGTLAYAVAREPAARLVLHDPSGAVSGHELPGLPETVAWTPGGALLVLAAEAGADTASLASGKPISSDAPTARSTREPVGWRRVWRLDPASGGAVAVSPEHLTVWQFAVLDEHRIVAVAGKDPSESGWYRAALRLLGPGSADCHVLHTSPWQLSAPAVSPDGRHVAFLEGWTSDRGLDTGDVRILDLASGAVTGADVAGADATSLRWAEDGRLWFAGWHGLGTAWGWLASAAEQHAVATIRYDVAGCVNSRWHPEVVPLPHGRALTVRSTEQEPPEVVAVAQDGQVEKWSTLNENVDRLRAFDLRELRWRSGDVELEGLLALPRGLDGPYPLVVDIHGGPSLAYHHSWDLTWAETLAPAGYALLLPNPYGGPGRGQVFARENLGDPAGAEFEQILAGVRQCVAEGIADEQRVAAMGASYGGYLTAWAVARGEVFRGGVVIAGISNLVSAWGTANNARFFEYLCEGVPNAAPRRYADRSPVSVVSDGSLPALILHGELDQCVPVAQARELFTALDRVGVPAELVVYPGEGHQTRGIEHLRDQRGRILAFLAEIFTDSAG